ncbi:MAG: hypothetical protein FWD63_02465 [Propionibacteriaceae bacterium]|nr:hypothetical protein [Propionibacteriaceae bacterium]
MANLLQIETEHGETVVFEVDDTEPGPVGLAPGEVIPKLDAKLEDILAGIRPAAAKVVDVFKDLGPDTCQIQFGITITAAAGAVIAKAGGSANITVTLTWAKPSS